MKPKISFVTPMKEKDFRVIALLESIRKQRYPKNRIEILIIDGGSNPDVLRECKKYGAKIYNNPKMLAEGAGMGKDQGIWKSKGEFVVIAESDIELVGNNWINNMLKPFLKYPNIFGAAPRTYSNLKDNLTNRYLSYVGVDPFAAYRSLEGQLELNPNLISGKKKDFFILNNDKKEPFCMGSNGFMFRRNLIKKVGDYAQDVEFIARLAKNDYLDFAVVENAPVWHKNVKGMKDFIKKRIKWTRNYTKIYIHEKKDFQWMTDKRAFLFYALRNLLFFPNALFGVQKSVRTNDPAWLLHGPMMFFSTALNIYFSLTSKKMMQQVFG